MTAWTCRRRWRIAVLAASLLLGTAVALGQAAREPVNVREILLRAARNQANAGQFAKALAYYRKYLERWPQDTTVSVEFAGVLISTAKVDEAAPVLQKVLEKEPDNLDALQRLVDVHFIKKEFTTAAKLLEDAVRRFAQDRPLRRKLAEAYTWLKRYEDAVAQYNYLLKQQPGDVELEKMILRTLYWGTLYDQYLRESAIYLKRHPRDMTVWLTRVSLCEAKKDFGGVIRECHTILELQPDHPTALAKMAQSLAWLGQRQAAIKAYEGALARNPKDTGLRREYAQQLLWSGKYRRAVMVYRKLKTDLPGNEDVIREYLEAAVGARPMNSIETGFIKKFHKSHFLAKKPLQPATLAALAKALQRSGQAADALAVFDRAVGLAPHDIMLRLQYADLLSALGKAEEAEKQYQILLKKMGKLRKVPE